jgi:hypothetical protein
MNHGQRQFFYSAPCIGSVQGVYALVDPVTGQTLPRFFVDVLPHDNRGAMLKVPVFTIAGSQRNLRKGMGVLIFFIDGDPQSPVVLGHNFNLEAPTTLFADKLQEQHTNIDDLTMVHEETGVWSRVRAIDSTAAQSAIGSPAQIDYETKSGVALNITEYPPDSTAPAGSPPNPPTRAKTTLTMPSGLTLIADEPSTGESTVEVSHPSGLTIKIDAQGNVTMDSPGTVEIDAPTKILLKSPNVELGMDDGRTLAFFEELMAHVSWDETHTHSGVTSGMGVSGPPENPPPVPVGTVDTFAT